MAAADWSQIPNDLLSFISNKLDVVADRCRFRSVCKSWRCSLPPFAQPPFLMLSLSQQPPPELPKEIVYEDEEEDENEEEEEEEDDDEEEEEENPPSPSLCLRGFVGIGGGANERNMVYEIELPEAHLRRCVGSTGNWLITVDKSGRIYLLNPFSKVQFDLPRQSKFEYGYQKGDKKLMTLEQYRDCLLKKVILSSSTPSSITNKNCIAMAIHHYKYKLAIARPGDTSWTTVDSPNGIFFEDIIIYKQQFYAVDRVGRVVVCDIDIADNNALLHTPKTSVVMESWLEELRFHKLYLVEWCGQLLLVIKFLQNLRMNEEGIKQKQLPMYKTEKFKIYKLDFVYKKWEELNSLGKYCLFLGYNTSVSVETCKYSESLEGNCIYFTDDFTYGYRGTETPGGLDMGVFNLDDKSIRPHYEGVSTCYYSPPLWIIPTSSVHLPRNSTNKRKTRTMPSEDKHFLEER